MAEHAALADDNAPTRRHLGSMRWAWVGLHVTVLAVSTWLLTITWPAPPGTLVLREALLTQAVTDPPTLPVTLPHDWRANYRDAHWLRYATEFELAEVPQVPWALLLPSVRMSAGVRINGHALSPPQDLADPLPRNWRRPMVYPVASGLLIAGHNRVEIEVIASPRAGLGYLSAVLAGPLASLAEDAARRHFFLQTLVKVIIASMAGIGLLMLLVWSISRPDTVYLWFGLGMLAWAGRNLVFIVRHPPLPAVVWDAWMYISMGVFVALSTLFIHRYLGLVRPIIERTMVAVAALGVPLFLLRPGPVLWTLGDRLWNPAMLGVGLYLCVLMHLHAWRTSRRDLHLLAACGTVVVVCGAHDALVANDLLPWGSGYMLHYSAAGVLMGFTALLMVRFAQGQAVVERLNESLQERVQEATRTLQEQHDRLRLLERKRWLSDERERIARDMHDGVGGQLLALLMRVRRGQLPVQEADTALSEAISDLRLVIDSLEADEGDLGTALATYRHRLERRLHGTGVQLDWQPGDLPLMPGYGPAEILNVLRVIDEAATNALRHAQASTILIRFWADDDRVEISVSDTGHGGAAPRCDGYGMRNLERRAQALGGELLLRSDATGTCVTLRLPAGEPRQRS